MQRGLDAAGVEGLVALAGFEFVEGNHVIFEASASVGDQAVREQIQGLAGDQIGVDRNLLNAGGKCLDGALHKRCRGFAVVVPAVVKLLSEADH